MLKKSIFLFLFISVFSVFSVLAQQQKSALKVTIEAPDFAAETLDGQPFQLAEQQGKVTLLVFWATWCPSCKKELPYLEQQIWRELADSKDFTLITVAEAEPNKLKKLMKQGNFTFPVISDVSGELAALFETQAVPTHFVINGKGEIVDYQRGFSPKLFAMLKNSVQKEIASLEKTAPPKNTAEKSTQTVLSRPTNTFDFLKMEVRPAKKP